MAIQKSSRDQAPLAAACLSDVSHVPQVSSSWELHLQGTVHNERECGIAGRHWWFWLLTRARQLLADLAGDRTLIWFGITLLGYNKEQQAKVEQARLHSSAFQSNCCRGNSFHGHFASVGQPYGLLPFGQAPYFGAFPPPPR